jgi:hypothetical protein
VNFPGDYAVTQFNRGSAFLRLALEEHNPQSSLRSAEMCFKEAEELFTQCGQAERAREARERAESVRSHSHQARPDEVQDAQEQQ